ncbi:uncharacterized protein LOC129577250 [Sitodiplosis mosellana]|uniref:uncharacterized protein LOC129577250 n=1 Tax=Sitodiplosis mosellana TaxID=263140 RepID=UPI00244435F8|nr:uncharacterized protein LOC129577250 [Sitodiplosis mosellana]
MKKYHNSENPAKNNKKTSQPTKNIQTQLNTSTFDKAEIRGNANNIEGAVVITSHEILTGGRRFNITVANPQDATANYIDVENTNKQVDNTHCDVSSSEIDRSDDILSDSGDDHQLKQQQQQPADKEIHTNSEEQPVQSVALLQASDENVLDVRNESVVTSSSENEESFNHSYSNGHDSCNSGNSRDEDDSEQSGGNKRVEITVGHDDCVKMGYFNKKNERNGRKTDRKNYNRDGTNGRKTDRKN